MSMNYLVLNDGKLVIESWEGTVSHGEVMSHERQHMQDPSIQAGASVLIEATGATFQTALEAIQEVTDLYRSPYGQQKIGKCAILVNRDAYDRARLFEKLAAPHGVNVIVFNVLDTACRWLGIDVNVVREQLKTITPRPCNSADTLLSH